METNVVEIFFRFDDDSSKERLASTVEISASYCRNLYVSFRCIDFYVAAIYFSTDSFLFARITRKSTFLIPDFGYYFADVASYYHEEESF